MTGSLYYADCVTPKPSYCEAKTEWSPSQTLGGLRHAEAELLRGEGGEAGNLTSSLRSSLETHGF